MTNYAVKNFFFFFFKRKIILCIHFSTISTVRSLCVQHFSSIYCENLADTALPSLRFYVDIPFFSVHVQMNSSANFYINYDPFMSSFNQCQGQCHLIWQTLTPCLEMHIYSLQRKYKCILPWRQLHSVRVCVCVCAGIHTCARTCICVCNVGFCLFSLASCDLNCL